MKKLIITPIGKPRMTQRDKWAKRPCVARYWAFKDELRKQWDGDKVPCQICLTFHLPMPKSWSKKRRNQMLGTPHKQKPDIDNLVKSFLDCLLEDDSYVWRVDASKLWSEGGSIEFEEISDR